MSSEIIQKIKVFAFLWYLCRISCMDFKRVSANDIYKVIYDIVISALLVYTKVSIASTPKYHAADKHERGPTLSHYMDTGLTSPTVALKWLTLTRKATGATCFSLWLDQTGITPPTCCARSERFNTRSPRLPDTVLTLDHLAGQILY